MLEILVQEETVRSICSFYSHGKFFNCLMKLLEWYQNKQVYSRSKLPPYTIMYIYKVFICSFTSLYQNAYLQILFFNKVLIGRYSFFQSVFCRYSFLLIMLKGGRLYPGTVVRTQSVLVKKYIIFKLKESSFQKYTTVWVYNVTKSLYNL